ncbi:MAG: FAD-dependent oxidoreductase [Chloroflexi bacterium HGW-Chloroflexi-8]|nr:MAG: FAD-dependent oxidoreductase [Chloroflexi bacterium HGW-Chloroflexi-8]
MSTENWRDSIWSDITSQSRQSSSPNWDVIVIGGGIVGAGVFREAVRAGLKTLLVDAHDFSSGTSSRSSKMVHGGFRYLKNAQIKLTIDSVRERKRLLKEGIGLINPLPFTLVSYYGDHIPSWVFGLGLVAYDALALRWNHTHFSCPELQELCPQINKKSLLGGYQYYDAQTDDARLVYRVIQEAQSAGGIALNYARVEGLLRNQAGKVAGIQLRDLPTGKTAEIHARVVINASGAWADQLRSHVNRSPRLRLLRGSHLIFPHDKLPIQDVISFLHPQDHRPVFAFSWEGATLVGTTDVDHTEPMDTNPSISPDETDYLMTAVDHIFGCLDLKLSDVRSSMAGIRSVLDTGKEDPSREARDEILWDEDGLITITGGKLTMFRQMACQSLKLAQKYMPEKTKCNDDARALDPVSEADLINIPYINDLDPLIKLRLLGRYSSKTFDLLSQARPDELTRIPNTLTLWSELRWAAHAEQIVHLDDLLLRRTRLGNLLPNGGLDDICHIRAICQSELGWDDQRWQTEETAYSCLWHQSYSTPGLLINSIGTLIPEFTQGEVYEAR